MERRRNSALIAATVLSLMLALVRQATAASTGSYESGGKKILIDEYASAEPGKRPAIILLHGSAGLLFPELDLRTRARALSEQGRFLAEYFPTRL